MTFRGMGLAAALVLAPAVPVLAQGPIVGTWQAKTPPAKDRQETIHTIVIRPDSSASYGKEVVRWRLRPDSILIALGGEWVAYRLKVRGEQLTLSGGDLVEPITLRRIGPPSARPASVAVPPDPDTHPDSY